MELFEALVLNHHHHHHHGVVCQDEARRVVRDHGGLRGRQRVLQVGLVPVDHHLRRGGPQPGRRRSRGGQGGIELVLVLASAN